ncbi:MAG: head GIN domain-containing protein [Myxococcota bacterium]
MLIALMLASTVGITERVEVQDFTKFRHRGGSDIKILVDPSAPERVVIELTGDEESIEKLEIASEKGELSIGPKRDSNMRRFPDIRFKVRSLEEIASAGSGDIRVAGLDGDMVFQTAGSGDLQATGDIDECEISVAGSSDVSVSGISGDQTKVRIAGSGDVTVSGKSRKVLIEIAGSGDVDARGLTAEKAQVQIAGSGNASVCATDSIKRQVRGSGDVDEACID